MITSIDCSGAYTTDAGAGKTDPWVCAPQGLGSLDTQACTSAACMAVGTACITQDGICMGTVQACP
jgi:hypothetical protein